MTTRPAKSCAEHGSRVSIFLLTIFASVYCSHSPFRRPSRGGKHLGVSIRWLTPPANFRRPSGPQIGYFTAAIGRLVPPANFRRSFRPEIGHFAAAIRWLVPPANFRRPSGPQIRHFVAAMRWLTPPANVRRPFRPEIRHFVAAMRCLVPPANFEWPFGLGLRHSFRPRHEQRFGPVTLCYSSVLASSPRRGDEEISRWR